jgi:predicted Fe-S protein YdhL (DUF1289 family)
MPVIETPCTKVCVVDPRSGLCVGCGRSLEEIGRWTVLTDGERRRIMADLPDRLATLGRPPVKDAGPIGGGAP